MRRTQRFVETIAIPRRTLVVVTTLSVIAVLLIASGVLLALRH
jgi:hypothetical protein